MIKRKLMIVVILVMEIISCGGAEDIAGSIGGDSFIVPDTESEPTPTFPNNTYIKVYTP